MRWSRSWTGTSGPESGRVVDRGSCGGAPPRRPSAGRRLGALAIALVLSACGASDDTTGPPAPRADIILVSIDSLRPDHLGCYGYDRPTSPRIDALARAGVRFDAAISTTSWTLPSHAALFTGLYDSAHGAVDNGLRLADGHTTLAEALRSAGWHTAGFYGGPYLHPTFGLAQGFETYVGVMDRELLALSEGEIRAEARAPVGSSHEDVTGPRMVRAVTEWLGTLEPDRPFFLFLHMWDVHYDYVPPPRYVEMFDPDYTGPLVGRGFVANRSIRADMPARDLEHLVALYDGEIRFTDDSLGEILDAVAARGRLDDALVVVTADHGEEFFEHGGRGHQRTLFDEVLRVPLIFHWPGRIAAGHRVRDQVTLIDLMPTLLSLVGVESPQPMQGRDLSPLLRGESLPARPALSELLVDRRQMRSMRSAEEKLITYGGRRFSLYDLDADPSESEPLRAEGDRLRRARSALSDLRRDTDAARQRLGFPEASAAPDPETCARLVRLGYLDPETDCGAAVSRREPADDG